MSQPEALDGLAEVPPVVRDHPAQVVCVGDIPVVRLGGSHELAEMIEGGRIPAIE
jgi:hypothetical protein